MESIYNDMIFLSRGNFIFFKKKIIYLQVDNINLQPERIHVKRKSRFFSYFLLRKNKMLNAPLTWPLN